MGVASAVRGQDGERGRAWPVAVRAFRRPPACGVNGGHYCELFQQLQAKNGRVFVCVCVVCVRESERGQCPGFLSGFFLNFDLVNSYLSCVRHNVSMTFLFSFLVIFGSTRCRII